MGDELGRKFDVFISYASKDKKWADAACAVLERHRIRCWVAPRDITPGTEWGAAIISGMDASKVMVLIFSTHANESAQVRREVERAISKGLIVLPFRVEDVNPAGAMEYALGNTHWLDGFTRPIERQFDLLANSVKSLLGETQQSQPDLPAQPTGPADPVETTPSHAPARLMIAAGIAGLTVICVGAGMVLFRGRANDPGAPRENGASVETATTNKPASPPERVAKKKRALDPDSLRIEQAALEGRWLPTDTANSKGQTGFSPPTAKKKGRGPGIFSQNVAWVMKIAGPTLRLTVEHENDPLVRGVVSLGTNGRRKFFDFRGKRSDNNPFAWYGIYEFEGDFLKLYIRFAADAEHPTVDRPDSFVVSTDNKGFFLKLKRAGAP